MNDEASRLANESYEKTVVPHGKETLAKALENYKNEYD